MPSTSWHYARLVGILQLLFVLTGKIGTVSFHQLLQM